MAPAPARDAVLEPLDPAALDELRPLWLALHARHQEVAPQLAPYVDDDVSWAERLALYREVLGREGSFGLVARHAGTAVGYAMVDVRPAAGSLLSDTWAT